MGSGNIDMLKFDLSKDTKELAKLAARRRGISSWLLRPNLS